MKHNLSKSHQHWDFGWKWRPGIDESLSPFCSYHAHTVLQDDKKLGSCLCPVRCLSHDGRKNVFHFSVFPQWINRLLWQFCFGSSFLPSILMIQLFIDSCFIIGNIRTKWREWRYHSVHLFIRECYCYCVILTYLATRTLQIIKICD